MQKIREWTKEEEQYLIDHEEKPLKEVAKHLERTVQSIKDKRRSLKLKREKIIPLQGKKFGKLLVIKEVGRKRRKVTWLCQCDCGNEKIVIGTNLITGITKSCGCYSREVIGKTNIKNLTGKKFGSLTVIKIVGRSKNYLVQWLCQCDCGEFTNVNSSNLLSGNTISCGCTRKLNQRKGIKWEYLIKKYLGYKYEKFIYHQRLPNNTIPDFMTVDKKIILDAKINDYLKIEVCIEKYSKYCERIVFICMEKKRIDWHIDFKNNSKVEFLYIENILSWIPTSEQNYFLNEIKKIQDLPVSVKNKNKLLAIQETIKQLEKENKDVTKFKIAKKIGSSKKYLRMNTDIDNLIDNYKKQKKIDIESKMLSEMEKIISFKISNLQKIMTQDIARILVKQKKNNGKIKEQEVWSLGKMLSTNKRYRDLIENSRIKLEEAKKIKVLETVKKLKDQDELITIMKLRELTKLPKNYLYSDKIKNLVKTFE